MDDQHELQPPVPAEPLVDSAVEANDPLAPAVPVEPGNDVQPDPDGEETPRGEGGEEGAEPYDGGEIPRTGDETLREEDRDPLNEDLDR